MIYTIILLVPLTIIISLSSITTKGIENVKSNIQKLYTTVESTTSQTSNNLQEILKLNLLAMMDQIAINCENIFSLKKDLILSNDEIIDDPAISRIINFTRIGEAGYVVILDHVKGIIIASKEFYYGDSIKETIPILWTLLNSQSYNRQIEMEKILVKSGSKGLSGKRTSVIDVFKHKKESGEVINKIVAVTKISGTPFSLAAITSDGGLFKAIKDELNRALEDVSTNVRGVDEESATLKKRFLIIISIMIFLSASIFFVVVIYIRKNFLKPISKLTYTARDIMEGEFSKRSTVKTGDELEVLGNTINMMVDRICSELGTKLQMASDIAHEMNNPLNYIATGMYNLKENLHDLHQFVENIFEDSDDEDALEVKNFFITIITNSNHTISDLDQGLNRLSIVINEIRGMSEVDGRISRKTEVVELIKNAFDKAKVRSDRSDLDKVNVNLDICDEFAQDNLYVEGNTFLLTRAISNIFHNALYYANKTDSPKIDVKFKFQKVRNEVYIDISNNGPPIETNQVKKIFNVQYSENLVKGYSMSLSKSIANSVWWRYYFN